MKKNYIVLLGILSLLMVGCTDTALFYGMDTTYKMGDNLDRSVKSYQEDDTWVRSSNVYKTRFWTRTKFYIDSIDTAETYGLSIVSYSSYDIFWDGVKIGSNGIIGDSEETEEPGILRKYFLLPNSLLTKGGHVLAIRHSNFHATSDINLFYTSIGIYEQMIKRPLIQTAMMYILGGMFLIVGLYYLFTYFKTRKEFIILLFGLISISFFFLVFIEYSKEYYEYTYDLHFVRLEIIQWLNFFIASLIPLFFLFRFQLKNKWTFYLFHQAYLIVLLMIYWRMYDTYAILISKSMWVFSVFVVGIAFVNKKRGSLPVLLGLLCITLLSFMIMHDVSLFLTFAILVLLMMYSMVIYQKEQKKSYELALSQSERLKFELQVQNIKPHFLMNTLTSLIELVEQSPEDSITLINSLSDEFRMLNKMADVKKVSIKEELQLCKSHIEVMRLRKEVQYKLKQKNIEYTETIPPAVIHTAIENGITHCLPNENNEISFLIVFSRLKEWKQYELITYGKPVSEVRREGGTGEQYIKSRLSESYGEDWFFESKRVPEGWKVLFRFKEK
ncbi:histidine kinase [Winogradskyella sp.]|uniref:histidine kinase n=1 Tax=Winogradskyella sp. TaxID=1883156 RepID=UPI0026163898|nr:sensor histidine kinase [Winogradskyella sp.]